MRLQRTGLVLILLAAAACSRPNEGADGTDGGTDGTDDGTDDGLAVPEGSLLADPLAPLPMMLSDVGLFPDPAARDAVVDVAFAYAPRWPLWSGGSTKQRWLVLPPDTTIDNGDPQAWAYPAGSLLFKSFADGDTPLETRLLRKQADGTWEYATYQWNEAADDAVLLDGDFEVVLELGDDRQHTIPSTLMCRECHESSPHPVLGDEELQLSTAADGGPSPLSRLAEAGLLAAPVPATPRTVADHVDATLPDGAEAVLGDFVGNCLHCHNGTDGASSSFDLDPAVALANTIDQPTESSASAVGTRIVPGDPAASVLFAAVSGESDDPELEPMPPVAIDQRDEQAIERLRAFILGLEGA